MFDLLVSDALRLAHLLAVAVGFGVAVETEAFMLKRHRTKISPGLMSGLSHRHMVILYALGAMWVTGAALVALRTGFVLSEFTPKLWAKVTVVTILSVNAALIAGVAMPILASHAGHRISALPKSARRALFAVAGISATSWLVAMLLGSSVLLKTGPAIWFQWALPAAYILGVLIANLVGQHLYAPRFVTGAETVSEPARPMVEPTPQAATKAPRPAPPRAAVTHTLEAAQTPKSIAASGPSPAAPKRKPARKLKPPKIELRASDLAIAFPQKPSGRPRLKPDPNVPPAQRQSQLAARERLLDVAAELTAKR